MTHEIPQENVTGDSPETEPNGSGWKSLAKRRIGLSLVGVLLLGSLGFLGMRAGAKTDRPQRGDRRQQITPVMVAQVTQKTVPVQIQDIVGLVQAENTVSVTPQIGGQITGVYFKKGQEVRKGQLLFTLDDRTALAGIQQAQGTLARDQAAVQQARATLSRDLGLVKQAEATLAKDEAQGRFAQAQASRYTALYKQGAISQDQAQQYSTNSQISAATLDADRQAIANAEATVRGDEAAIQNAEAVVSADQGALQNAQVQISYTKIYAPIDGRAGDILVNQGNVVQANSTNPLVKITQVHPIQVSFSVDESNLPALQRYTRNGRLPVAVNFPNSNAQPLRGGLTFVNNTVDNTTGTIQLLGEFSNDNGELVPGQYVKTTLTLTTQPNATVVPSQAVQNGPNGQFVFVVKPVDDDLGDANYDGTVENVPVTVSSSVNGLSVIQKGLKPGDRVVTDGQANLVPGSKIRIRTALNAPGGNNPGEGNRGAQSPDGNNSAQPGQRRHRSQNTGGNS
jgi:multidrug efflux system membrane fusion protein